MSKVYVAKNYKFQCVYISIIQSVMCNFCDNYCNANRLYSKSSSIWWEWL